MRRTHAGAACGELSPVGGILRWSREESEEEGAAETMYDELTTTPVPRALELLCGGGKENQE